MEKEFNFDELKEQVKDKSKEELRAEINEMLECLTSRDTLIYHRVFMEAWIAYHLPATYRMYLERKNEEK